jgi:hypothetical protein
VAPGFARRPGLSGALSSVPDRHFCNASLRSIVRHYEAVRGCSPPTDFAGGAALTSPKLVRAGAFRIGIIDRPGVPGARSVGCRSRSVRLSGDKPRIEHRLHAVRPPVWADASMPYLRGGLWFDHGRRGEPQLLRVFARITTTSGVVPAERLSELGFEGYDTVINLLPDSSEHEVASEAHVVNEQVFAYIHILCRLCRNDRCRYRGVLGSRGPPCAGHLHQQTAGANHSPPRMGHRMRIEPSFGRRTPSSWLRLGLGVTKPGRSVDRDAAESWVTWGGRSDGT